MGERRDYRRDVDGLRAVAVSAVVIHHAFPSVAPGGFVGVDLFFVISGYLITRILADQRDAGTFSWGGFYLRRARRIIPAYVVIILVAVGLAALVEMPRLLTQTGAAAGASGLFLANVLFARSSGYFGPGAQQNPLLHLWSLSVEEQFYLVWPALIALLSLGCLRRARAGLALVSLAASLSLAQVWTAGGNADAAFFHLVARAWEFQAGGVLALGLVKPPGHKRTAEVAAVCGLLAITWSLVFLNEASRFPGLSALPACLGVAAVIWSGTGGDPGTTAFLRSAPVVGLGLISYSLYLWHWPLLVLAADVAQKPLTLIQRLGILAVSAVLAMATWRWVEQPFRRGPIDRPWKRLGPALLPLLGPIAAGALLFFGHGLPQRFSPTARALADLEETDTNPARKTCLEHRGSGGPDACRFGAAPGVAGEEVVVWGDSHADAVTPGVVEWARRRGWSVREAARSGCPPVAGVSVRLSRSFALDCGPAADETLAAIAANPRLKLVVLAARWPLYRDAAPFYDVNSPRVSVELAARPAVKPGLASMLGASVEAIARRHPEAKVLILGPVPELTLAPPECLAQQRQWGLDLTVCARVAAGPPLARAMPAEAEIAAVVDSHAGVAAVYPTRTLCVDGGCAAMTEGRSLYFDDDHLGAWGARRLVPEWMDEGWAELERR